MPVRKLVLTMSSPIMLSMLTGAIYNLVDSIYVAQVSDLDFLALSYAYPVQLMIVAFCAGLGVGFNAILAKRLGEGRLEDAVNAACHGFLLYGAVWLLALIFALVGCTPLLPKLLGQSGGGSVGHCLSHHLLRTVHRPLHAVSL